MCFTLAFMSGLLFVPLPTVYPLAYIGLGLGHLLVRGIRHRASDWRDALRWLVTGSPPPGSK